MEVIDTVMKVRASPGLRNHQEQLTLKPWFYLKKYCNANQDRDMLTGWGALFNPWLKAPKEKVLVADEIMNLLYDGLVLMNDAIGSLDFENGLPRPHSVYGIPLTINSSILVFLMAAEKLQEFGHPDAVKVFTEKILEICRGWSLETHWKTNTVCPSEEEYMLMAFEKLGDYLSLPVQLLQLCSTTKTDFTRLIYLVSLYYHIGNDNKNLLSNKDDGGNGINDGKFSFPILHAIRKDDQDFKLIRMLKSKTQDEKTKQFFIGNLKELGSFKYAEGMLDKIEKLIRKEISALEPNPDFERYFEDLKRQSKGE